MINPFQRKSKTQAPPPKTYHIALTQRDWSYLIQEVATAATAKRQTKDRDKLLTLNDIILAKLLTAVEQDGWMR